MQEAPFGSLLSSTETQLCASVPMLPLHYLAAKEAIVREAYRNGQLSLEGVKRVYKVCKWIILFLSHKCTLFWLIVIID